MQLGFCLLLSCKPVGLQLIVILWELDYNPLDCHHKFVAHGCELGGKLAHLCRAEPSSVQQRRAPVVLVVRQSSVFSLHACHNARQVDESCASNCNVFERQGKQAGLFTLNEMTLSNCVCRRQALKTPAAARQSCLPDIAHRQIVSSPSKFSVQDKQLDLHLSSQGGALIQSKQLTLPGTRLGPFS